MGNAIMGEEKTIKQIVREQKRELDRAIRSLDSERNKLKIQEQRLIQEMKKMARENSVKSVKIMAKDLIRIRKHQEKFIDLTAKLRAVSLQMQTMASTQQLTESMRGATLAMRRMNRQMNLPVLNKIMTEFAKQSEMMEMGSEVMSDAIDMAMDDEEDEIETENVVNQVLDEIGITLADEMLAPGTKSHEATTTKTTEADPLAARLNNLGK